MSGGPSAQVNAKARSKQKRSAALEIEHLAEIFQDFKAVTKKVLIFRVLGLNCHRDDQTLLRNDLKMEH